MSRYSYNGLMEFGGCAVATESIELRRLLPGHQPGEDACTDLIGAALAALEGVLAARFVAVGAPGSRSITTEPRGRQRHQPPCRRSR